MIAIYSRVNMETQLLREFYRESRKIIYIFRIFTYTHLYITHINIYIYIKNQWPIDMHNEGCGR